MDVLVLRAGVYSGFVLGAEGFEGLVYVVAQGVGGEGTDVLALVAEFYCCDGGSCREVELTR